MLGVSSRLFGILLKYIHDAGYDCRQALVWRVIISIILDSSCWVSGTLFGI